MGLNINISYAVFVIPIFFLILLVVMVLRQNKMDSLHQKTCDELEQQLATGQQELDDSVRKIKKLSQ